MIIALKWIQKNPWKTFLICACAFVIPLLLVHICYSFELSWISSKWSAGDVLGYIAGFETCLGTMALGALSLWQNEQIRQERIESMEPCLSMKILDVDGVLYLYVENNGKVEAKDIRLELLSLINNGEKELYPDELFNTVFALYPREVIRGKIALSGANVVTQIFPQAVVGVSYTRGDLNRPRKYERTVTYLSGNPSGKEKSISTEIEKDIHRLSSDLDKIARANVRVANYLDGCQVLKLDELNIMPGKSLRNDLVGAIKMQKEVPVVSREDAINKF